MEIDMEALMPLLTEYGIKLAGAVAIYIIGKMVAKMVTNLLKKSLQKSGTDSMLVDFLTKIAYSILLIAIILAALGNLGIPVTSLVAIFGAAGLAVGLALKDSLSNFASGVMIIIFRPFKIGDFITAGGSTGVVDEIGLFCTLLHTGDNQRIILPNAAVLSGTIVNTSALATRRIDLVIGIGYEDNIGKARDVILGVIDADSRILKDPEASVGVSELGDSCVNLNVRPWVNSADYWPVRADLLENIKISLDSAGISIPYPQQDVHMHAVDTAA